MNLSSEVAVLFKNTNIGTFSNSGNITVLSRLESNTDLGATGRSSQTVLAANVDKETAVLTHVSSKPIYIIPSHVTPHITSHCTTSLYMCTASSFHTSYVIKYAPLHIRRNVHSILQSCQELNSYQHSQRIHCGAQSPNTAKVYFNEGCQECRIVEDTSPRPFKAPCLPFSNRLSVR